MSPIFPSFHIANTKELSSPTMLGDFKSPGLRAGSTARNLQTSYIALENGLVRFAQEGPAVCPAVCRSCIRLQGLTVVPTYLQLMHDSDILTSIRPRSLF
jgi:hypothetical protein